MKKQKICIIGGSLTGLVTAISLSKLDCDIDLITGDLNRNLKTNRTIAISENNLNFLNKLNISHSLKKEIWGCSVMKLYSEIKNEKVKEVFELDKEKKQGKVLYIAENKIIIKKMIDKINKIKSINLKNGKKVYSIYNSGLLKAVKFDNHASKYNLVIICTGHNSNLIKEKFDSKIVKNSYQETAITTILNHDSCKNNIVRQIFFKKGILALLPISNKRTSVVLSIKNNINIQNVNFFKNKIRYFAKNYFKNINFLNNIEFKDLNLFIRSKYFFDRVLLFGDALHVIHPFVGQGFNMTLRDLESLQKILFEKISLGLDVGSLDTLSEFSMETKPRNFAFSLSTDILKNSLSMKSFRNDALKILNKNNLAKNIFFDIADRGFRF